MILRNTASAVVMAILLVLSTAPAAQADSSAFFGINFPTGDFTNAAGTGWNLGAYVTGNLLPIVDVGAIVAYNDFSTKQDNHEVGAVFGPTVNAWEFEALGQVNILFLKGFIGLGFANYSGVDDAGESKRKTDFAWQVGAAMKALLLEWRLSYHQFSAEQTSVNWISLSAGIVF